MMRIETVYWEVVHGPKQRVRFDTEADAKANRDGGQVRRRVDHVDVPAEYSIRLDGTELGREARAGDAAVLARSHPGATVHMVPAAEAAPTPL